MHFTYLKYVVKFYRVASKHFEFQTLASNFRCEGIAYAFIRRLINLYDFNRKFEILRNNNEYFGVDFCESK